MTTANDIKDAVAVMDSNDSTLWEAPGRPKIDILRTLVGDQKIEDVDVEAALGLLPKNDRTDDLMGLQAALPNMPEAAKDPKDKPPQVQTAPAVPIPDPLPNDPTKLTFEEAQAVVVRARNEIAKLSEEQAGLEVQRDEAVRKLDALRVRKDVHATIIETYGPRVTHAESVKAIQRQNVERLASTKELMRVSQVALSAAGVKSYPSKLDESRAVRRRDPEQTARMAQFTLQRARERTQGLT